MESLDKIRKSGKIKYEVISGSHAYGTNNKHSDQDIRGIFVPHKDEYISMKDIPNQYNDNKNDIIFYSLKRFLDLASNANPNIIELLWIPKDCVIYRHNMLDPIFENRNKFITKSAYNSHYSYAKSQIKKAKGCNKRVNNPQPEEKPKREDFCFVIPSVAIDGYFKGRPIPIKKIGLDLSQFHVSKLEHGHNSFRLYDYSDSKSKGVFKNDAIVCQSIPYEDENKRYYGILIFNKDQYERQVAEWHNYWDWFKNRNDARWIDQEKGKLDYDCKNMMHCYRLLLSSKNILENGEPLVRFEGEPLAELRSIRNGDLKYEELISKVDSLSLEIDELYQKSKLPESVDLEESNNIFREVYEYK